jgi:hypothetical protein
MTQYNPRRQQGLPVVTSDVELHLEERAALAALTSELEQSGASPAQQLEQLMAFLADPAHTASAEAVMVMIRKNSFRAEPSQDEVLAELPDTHLENLLTADEASLFQRQGFFVIRNALPPNTVRTMQAVMDELEAEYKPRLNIGEHERVNLLDCLALDERLLQLLDHPSTFPKVWGLMGWHIALYIAQCTAYPPTATEDLDGSHGWHRDSGKFSIGERDPDGKDAGFEHQVSIKIAYALSEMDERTGMQVIPGTHLGKGMRGQRMHIPAVVGTQGTDDESEWWDKPREGGGAGNPTDPPTALGIPLDPGDAVIFDRRLFHSEPLNPFEGTWARRMVFLGYSHRWLRPRDEMSALGRFGGTCGPIRRQMLGSGPSGGTGFTSPQPEDVPLRDYLRHHFGEEGLAKLQRLLPLTEEDLPPQEGHGDKARL